MATWPLSQNRGHLGPPGQGHLPSYPQMSLEGHGFDTEANWPSGHVVSATSPVSGIDGERSTALGGCIALVERPPPERRKEPN